MSDCDYDAIVIGGGMYGCTLAVHLRRRLSRVLLLEAGPAILRRASYANQARVHHGYHYPRSLLTALRSRVNYARFTEEYGACLDHSFSKYYAIARLFSKVSASQFRTFCRRIGVPIEPAPAHIRKLFNRTLIEDVFQTEESAFDAVKLGAHLAAALERCDVTVRTGCPVRSVDGAAGASVTFDAGGRDEVARAPVVFNCTYSDINTVLRASGLAGVPFRHEVTELALVRVPEPLANVAVTVMDGPFFSVMPFPALGLHTLSHVRYTPHHWWEDDGLGAAGAPSDRLASFPRITGFPRMILPLLAESTHVDSLWEVKTVLPASDADDSRPILVHRDARLPAVSSILGGKIDNIFDVLSEVDALHAQGVLH
jgi:glycine/D-amino acid oxidase-like deaminating enzyme